LRSRIAALGRGGEYDLAIRLLHEHAALDLGVGLPSDSVRRAHQAAALAEHAGDATTSAESLLVLAISMLHVGNARAAARAAEVARARAGSEPRLVVSADLIRGMAERQLGRYPQARAFITRARLGADALAQPALSGAILVELGLLHLAEKETDAAATCFWFARDFHTLAHKDDEAARASAMALVAYASAERWSDVADLAPAIAADSEATGRLEICAHFRGLEADAHVAQASPDALDRARVAAVAAASLPEGRTRQELYLRARLRLAKLSTDSAERLRHLEAAIDAGVVAGDVPMLAQIAEHLLVEVMEGRTDRGVDLLTDLSAIFRRLGAFDLADMAAAAQSELE
jgi:hypothetical protein